MRMLNKSVIPEPDAIAAHLGAESSGLLERLEGLLKERYALSRELRFPFGNQYGWGYKYSHKQSHLCYAFFEQNGFTVMLQLGDACVPSVERALPELSPKARELWGSRYPCGEKGGWVNYLVTKQDELDEVMAFIAIKKKPVKPGARK